MPKIPTKAGERGTGIKAYGTGLTDISHNKPHIMIFKEDIIHRIKSDFKDLAVNAIDILQEAISKTDYLKTDRVIRCIIYLAEGDLNRLKKYIDTAIYDPRDVMLWAEYIKVGDDFKHKRVRDFNKTFEKCTEEIKE